MRNATLIISGWRNIWRQRRRTLITASSVAFGLLLSVTFTGSADYAYTRMIDTSATMGFGHVTVAAAGFDLSPSFSRVLSRCDEIGAAAAGSKAVTATRTRIIGQAMFAAGGRSNGGQVMGIDPETETAEFNVFLRDIIKGRMFAADDRRGALIGEIMARRLHLKPGRKLVYTATDRHGEMVSGVARVSGIFRTGVAEADSGMVLIPISRLRKVLGYGPDEAGMIAVFLADQRQSEEVRSSLARGFGGSGLEIMTWHKTQADLAGLIAMDRAGNYLMQFLVWLLVAAGIFNTMQMSVMERQQQFGIMQALGMAPFKIFFMIMVESFWIGLCGLAAGVIITFPWYVYMRNVGLNLETLIGSDYSAGGVLVDPVLKLRLFPETAAAIVFMLFVLVLLAAFYPALIAARTRPLVAMRHR